MNCSRSRLLLAGQCRFLPVVGLLFVLGVSTVQGQATLDFCNLSAASGINAPIFDTDGITKLGSGFRAQLYVGESPESLSPMGPSFPFRNLPGTSTGSGYIIAGKVVAPGQGGGLVYAEVRAWDAGAGTTYETARSAFGKTGKSATIQIKTGDEGLNLPGALTGLKSFSLAVAANQPPTSSGFGATTPQDQALTITFASLLAPVSDPEGGPVHLVSISATSTNRAAVTSNATAIVYSPKTGFVGADRFSYTVADASGATSTVLAQIAVLSAGTSVNTVQPLVVTADSASFSFTGLPSRTYEVQRAESLLGPWVTVGTLIIQPNGSGQYVDPTPPLGSGFYRTLLLP